MSEQLSIDMNRSTVIFFRIFLAQARNRDMTRDNRRKIIVRLHHLLKNGHDYIKPFRSYEFT